MIQQIQETLRAHVTHTQESAQRFFKTQPGTYGTHDQFRGICVPALRKIAKMYANVDLEVLSDLMASPWNEDRLLALFILTHQYQKADQAGQEMRYQFYMQHLKHVNNWNLVDASAHLIVGAHIPHHQSLPLMDLVSSPNLWERRIAIVATWQYIRQNHLETTFQMATLLLKDSEDLIHKAVGWMLREAGKRHERALITFLEEHAVNMPRTMLRYAIERLNPALKTQFLSTSRQGGKS